MMARPMKTLELHYPMIKFLIAEYVFHFPKCMKWSTNKTVVEILMIMGGLTVESGLFRVP